MLCAVMIQKRLERSTRLLNDQENHGNWNLRIFRWKNFHRWSCLQQKDNRVVAFRNNVSEHRRVSTTKHPASIMMFGVVALKEEKMLPIWLERGYRVSLLFIKKFLRRKFFQGRVEEDHEEIWFRLQQDGAPEHAAKTVPYWLYEALAQRVFASTIIRLQTPRFQLVNANRKKRLARHSSTDELNAFMNRAYRSMRGRFVGKVCKSFGPPLRHFITTKGGHIE